MPSTSCRSMFRSLSCRANLSALAESLVVRSSMTNSPCTIRPAALSRGPIPNETSLHPTLPLMPITFLSARSPGRFVSESSSKPRLAITRLTPIKGTISQIVPRQARSRKLFASTVSLFSSFLSPSTRYHASPAAHAMPLANPHPSWCGLIKTSAGGGSALIW